MTVEYDNDNDSLTKILALCGYTHRKAPGKLDHIGYREVVDTAGSAVFCGRYMETLEWLLSTGQAKAKEQAP